MKCPKIEVGAEKQFRMIYDSDMGNDIDDAFAQVMAAQSHSEGRSRLILSLSSNPNPWSVAAIDRLNRHYGVADCPVGMYRGQVWRAMDTYSSILAEYRMMDKNAIADGTLAMRKALFESPDDSVRVVATGFASNLTGVLHSQENHMGDGIPFPGKELIRRKVQFLSIMAADFSENAEPEFNVRCDIPSMLHLMREWPTDMFISDFTVGTRISVDWLRLERRLSSENPLKRAYIAYYQRSSQFTGLPPDPILNRPSWDQSSMLFALEPETGHFAVSEAGRVEILPDGRSRWHVDVAGNCRLLGFDAQHTPEKVNDWLMSRYYHDPVRK